MAQLWAIKFYKGRPWQDCRAGYIASVHGLCEQCTAEGRDKPGLIVHHTIELNPSNINDPEIALNWEHLMYLCQDHHNKVGSANSEVIREGLTFDTNGQVIEVQDDARPPIKKWPR